ncbi:hypothetical protein BpHYR1_039554, partial [Brachionus plicatilis]
LDKNEHRDELITRCSSTNKTIYPLKEIDTIRISKSNKESPDVSKPKKRTRTTAANKCQQPILKTQCLIKNKETNIFIEFVNTSYSIHARNSPEDGRILPTDILFLLF